MDSGVFQGRGRGIKRSSQTKESRKLRKTREEGRSPRGLNLTWYYSIISPSIHSQGDLNLFYVGITVHWVVICKRGIGSCWIHRSTSSVLIPLSRRCGLPSCGHMECMMNTFLTGRHTCIVWALSFKAPSCDGKGLPHWKNAGHWAR